MKIYKIGIIGGMSYKSTIHYYEKINRKINQIKGDLHCAEIILYNVDFGIIKDLMDKNEWSKIENYLSNIADQLEIFGADYIVLATDSMHKIADNLQKKISIPLIHIADCVAEECLEKNIYNLGLLGTKITMQEDFLKTRLAESNLKIQIPNHQEDIEEMDRIIFEELCNGKILETSKQFFLEVIKRMIEEQQIDGIILGCTEIEMLLKQEDINIPIFDTTQAHINKIVNCYLGKEKVTKPLTRSLIRN